MPHIPTRPRRPALALLISLLLLLAACGESAATAVAPGPVPAGATARLGKSSVTSLAAGDETLIAGDRSGVSRYDGAGLAPVWATAAPAPVTAVALAPGGGSVLAGLDSGDLLLLDGASGALQSSLPGFDPAISLSALAFAPDGLLFVAGYNNGQLLAGRAAAGELLPLGRLAPQSSGITALAFNDDGRILAAGDRGGGLALYDSASLGLLTPLEGHAGQAVSALAWNPDGDRLASGDAAGQVILWDMLRLSPLARAPQPGGAVNALAFVDGARFLSAATEGGELLAWDTASGALEPARATLPPLSAAAWDAQGTAVLLALADGRLQRRALVDGLPAAQVRAERHDHVPAGAQIGALALSPDGSRLLLGLGSETLLWDTARRAPLLRLDGHGASITAAAWAPDGRSFATAARDGQVLIRAAADGAVAQDLRRGPQAVTGLAWSPDGAQLAAAESLAGTITLWDAAGGTAVRTFAVDAPGLWSVAWSPDGAQLLGGGVDGKLYLFDAAGEAAAQDSLWRHLAWISAIAWPEAARVASASADNSVILWDLAAGNSTPLVGHSAPVRGVAFAPGAARLVSGGLDGQLFFWDADPRARQPQLARRSGHAAGVTAVAWSPDGTAVYSGSEDGTVIIWPPPAD